MPVVSGTGLNKLQRAFQSLVREEGMRKNKRDKHSKEFNVLKNLMISKLTELRSHLDQLRGEMVVEDEVDDEATHAFRIHNREFVMATMERETRNISEIEQALERIANDEYGACVTCETAIPENRLQAIPWTRLCVDCAGGGIHRSHRRALGQPAFGSSMG
jgi:DnaK suppressor protein